MPRHRRVHTSRILRVIAATVALCGAAAAKAAVITLTLTGSVSTVDPALSGTFAIGDPVSIVLRYDPASPPVAASASAAVYDFLAFHVLFGTYAASFASHAAGAAFLAVVNNEANTVVGPADAFGASAFEGGLGAPVGGGALQQGFFALYDASETAFHDTTLPLAPTLAAFPTLDVAGLSFCTNSGCGVNSLVGIVEASLTSMTAVTDSVPEPPTAALVLMSVGLLASRRRPRR